MITSIQKRPTKSSGDMRDQAYRICRNYLSGTWKDISSSDMVFKSINGGMSNLIYYCSLPETHTPLVGEPNQALLRMYGQIHDGQTDVTESVIFMLLSERKLGPQLYGIFPGGRLEEYIPARALRREELFDPEISAIIARKLASVHSLNVPINKEPTWLLDTMNKWLQYVPQINILELDPSKQQIAKELLSFDLKTELKWLEIYLKETNSPVVFCHNDLQEGNILFPKGRNVGDDKVVFIDFEFCSYSYRSFDLANHFLERVYDYSNPCYPNFTVHEEAYPSKEKQLEFLSHYLSVPNDDVPFQSEETILNEIARFSLASHFLWTLWAIKNAPSSKIKFGYWEYGLERISAYFQLKQLLTEERV